MQANEAVVQDLQGQRAEQRRTKHASHMGHNFVAQERLQVLPGPLHRRAV